MVQTVCGEAPCSGLGRMLLHEHITVGLLGNGYFTDTECTPMDDASVLASQLAQLATCGIGTIVDATTIGSGRDVELLKRVAEISGVQIVCATGLESAEACASCFGLLDAVRLADIFVRELCDGIPGSDVCAGALVLTLTGAPSSFDEELVLAVAFAHAETGVPVLARAHSCSAGLWQVERLKARGVDPERIAALHVDRPSTSLAALDAVAHTGACLGFTRIGHDDMDEDARAAMVAYATRRLGPDRLCLSMSSWARWLGPPHLVDGGRGFGFLEPFLEKLRSYGVPEGDVDALLATNPQRLFA